MATMGRNLRLQSLVIYHCKGEGPTIHRWYLVGIGGHCASEKLRLKKVIFEFFFKISKTKKLSPITSYYGKNFRFLAQSLRKLQQKDDFTKFFFVWKASTLRPRTRAYGGILKFHHHFCMSQGPNYSCAKFPEILKKNSRPSFEYPKKFQLKF
jgi:hypothetical protein